MIDFSGWTKATGDLKPGQQRVFKDFLTLVSEGQATLVHGADYDKYSPCLVNGVAPMLAHTKISPMSMFPEVVSNFDRVCREMAQHTGMQDEPNRVSPIMADFLLASFGEMKDMELATTHEAVTDAVYIEPSDKDMMDALEAMQCTDAPISEGINELAEGVLYYADDEPHVPRA